MSISDLTIKTRFILVSISVALSMLVILSMGMYSTHASKQLNSALYQKSTLQSGLLTLRRNEKDFLARIDTKYYDKFTANYEKLSNEITGFHDTLADLSINNTGVKKLSTSINNYAKSFDALYKEQLKIGLNPKDGLYGQLRTAVHNAEKDINQVSNAELLSDMLMLRRREKDFMLRLDPKYLDKFEKDFIKIEQRLATSPLSDDLKEKISGNLKRYQKDFFELANAYKRKGLSSKEGHLGNVRKQAHDAESMLAELEKSLREKITSESAYMNNFMTIASVVMALINILFIIIIMQGVIKPISTFRKTMLEINNHNDLRIRMPINSKDELGETSQAFNQMLNQFESLIQQVFSSSQQLSSASQEVMNVAENSSMNVDLQRRETDQVATAINEMTASIQEVSYSAQHAAEAASKADIEATSGISVVQETSGAIKQLATDVESASKVILSVETDSETIGSVLDVIKGIAEQTNLLALNAAIEAARAGEQGRGFAVVADEVRTLASRTQESTKEIEDMIVKLQIGSKEAVVVMEQGLTQAQSGVKLSMNAASSLDSIAKSISEINSINTQIAAAAEEQSSVSEEINKNIVNISQQSDETASGAAQTTASSAEMANLAKDLQEIIVQYKIS